MDCILDRPTCKRTLMERRGPYKKEICPLSEKPKCMLKKDQCPLVPDTCNCALDKVIDIIQKGGCFAGQPQGCCCCCCAPEQETKPMAECRVDKVVALPPCTRCRKGMDPQPKEPAETAKPEEVKKPKETVKKPKETVKKLKETKKAKEKKKKSEKRPKGLTVPDCTLSSRRPYPCCECLLKRLQCPITNEEYDSSLVYCCARENKCPFTQVIDMCDSDCDCFDVCPIYTGLPCPFLPQQEAKIEEVKVESTLCPCCDPQYVEVDLDIREKPKGRCCFCPLIPDPCSLTAPECPVHSGKMECPLQFGGTCPDYTLPQREERRISCICTQIKEETVKPEKPVKTEEESKDAPEATKSELVLNFKPSESRLEKMGSTNRFNVEEEATVLEKPKSSPSPIQDRLQKSHRFPYFVDFRRPRGLNITASTSSNETTRSTGVCEYINDHFDPEDFPRVTVSDLYSAKSVQKTKSCQCRKSGSRMANYPSIANQTLYRAFPHYHYL